MVEEEEEEDFRVEEEDTIQVNAAGTTITTVKTIGMMIMVPPPLRKDRQAMVVGKVGGIDRRIKIC